MATYYSDVTMGAIASQITSLIIVYSTVYPGADQRKSLRWRHNDHAGVSNHQPRGCLLNRLFRRRSKKTSKLRVTGLKNGQLRGKYFHLMTSSCIQAPCHWPLWGIYWWPVNSLHKWPVTRKMFPFDDVIMNRPLNWKVDSGTLRWLTDAFPGYTVLWDFLELSVARDQNT